MGGGQEGYGSTGEGELASKAREKNSALDLGEGPHNQEGEQTGWSGCVADVLELGSVGLSRVQSLWGDIDVQGDLVSLEASTSQQDEDEGETNVEC